MTDSTKLRKQSSQFVGRFTHFPHRAGSIDMTDKTACQHFIERLVQRPSCSSQLLGDRLAGVALGNHALDTAHLSLDSRQAGNDSLPMLLLGCAGRFPAGFGIHWIGLVIGVTRMAREGVTSRIFGPRAGRSCSPTRSCFHFMPYHTKERYGVQVNPDGRHGGRGIRKVRTLVWHYRTVAFMLARRRNVACHIAGPVDADIFQPPMPARV